MAPGELYTRMRFCPTSAPATDIPAAPTPGAMRSLMPLSSPRGVFPDAFSFCRYSPALTRLLPKGYAFFGPAEAGDLLAEPPQVCTGTTSMARVRGAAALWK